MAVMRNSRRGGQAVVVGHVLEGEVPGDQGVLQGAVATTAPSRITQV